MVGEERTGKYFFSASHTISERTQHALDMAQILQRVLCRRTKECEIGVQKTGMEYPPLPAVPWYLLSFPVLLVLKKIRQNLVSAAVLPVTTHKIPTYDSVAVEWVISCLGTPGLSSFSTAHGLISLP